MSYRYTDYPYLLNRHPGELKNLILETARQNEAHMASMADSLGVATRILYGYIYKLNILEDIRQIRDQFRDARRRGGRIRVDTSTFGTLVRTNPEEAKRVMEWAYADAGEDATRAAKDLGVPVRRFYLYATHLGLRQANQTAIAASAASAAAVGASA